MQETNEADIWLETQQHYKSLASKVVGSLARNNIEAEFAADRSQALAKVIRAIPKGATIGIGDSVTLHQIGLFEWLEKECHQVFNPFVRHSDGEPIYTSSELFEVMRQAMTADVFLASSNAVTLDGKLVNADGRGNRVAAMLFGPKKTILVIGANKIVKDVEQALMRIKFVAAPMNNRRHLIKHRDHFLRIGLDLNKVPCVATGACISTQVFGSCTSPERACHKIVIIDGQVREPMSPEESGISVILVGESLGL